MALFCIPKNLVEKLKQSAIKGEVDIKNLYDMSSQERRDFFAKHTDEELGKFINTEFEKAMVSKQKTALTDWAKSIFSPKKQAEPVFKSVLDKINALDEIGVLNPKTEQAFLEDLVSDRLGIRVSPDEVHVISEKAKKIDVAQAKLGNDLGNPAKLQENIDFFKAKKELDDYLQGQNPAGKIKILTGTIMRGMMLFSAKSPVLNIGSNIEVGITEALSRRLASGQYKGTDNQLAIDYVKMVNRIYQKTGYDISRMTSLSDSGASGQRVLGDTVHAQGGGLLRKGGRVIEDIVFKQLMGAPDVAFSSAHFADSVNLNALKLTEGDAVKAREIMNDAMRLTPQTSEGEILRNQGILDAQTATWTNKTWAADVSMGIRNIINKVSGDLRLGDYLFPFVKTPANVIATGMDYAGFGVLKALKDTIVAAKSGELGSREYISKTTRNLVRSGLGLTGAFLIASLLKDDDFVGAYDPSRAQIEQLRNSNYNAVRIGGKWISLDWFGPLSVPLTSMLYARKYGKKGWSESIFQYGKGVISSVQNLPGVKDVADFYSSHQQDKTLEEMTGETGGYLIDQATSRLIPSFISDTAKATDSHDRVNRKGAIEGSVDAFKAKIPGLRETLPVKTNVFGQESTGEPAWSDILFGARVKTDKETAVIKEISNVSTNTDKPITFTNWDKSSGKTLLQFKEKIGADKFNEAKIKYGQELLKQLEQAMKKPKYNKLTDDEKLKILNGLDATATDKIFKQYHFKYKPVKTKKINL